MSILKTVVEDKIKSKFISLAKSKGLSESAFLRQIVFMVTGEVQEDFTIKPVFDKRDLVKKSIYIPRFLLEGIEQKRKQQGMALSRWIVSLIQSNLMAVPVVTDAELIRLRESIRELNYIGNNINQIARALNENYRHADRVNLDALVNLETLKTLEAAIEKNVDAIYVFVGAKNRAWAAKNEPD